MNFETMHDNEIRGRYRTRDGIWLCVSGHRNRDGEWLINDPAGWYYVKDVRKELTSCGAEPIIPRTVDHTHRVG